ncbi:MAG: hypothetical protein LBT49_03885 [Prevotellaceae bacterium]|nr:hypothetical protein [Prevotellaceae bacterium]
MATATARRPSKRAVCKPAAEAEKPGKLSKAGQWLRDNPNRGDGVVINDPGILYGKSIIEILNEPSTKWGKWPAKKVALN